MSSSQEQPWSDDPNTPKIPYGLYFAEKTSFAGVLIGPILYGITIAVFFRCMAALLDPVHRGGEGIKWGLVSYVVVTFSVVTILAGMRLNVEAISYIDNRRFPGVGGVLPPGPLGYQWSIYSKTLSIVPDLMFLLNNWLADGLLLYRCYVVYSMNLWAIALPCLMYLGSLVMGVMFIYQTSKPLNGLWSSVVVVFGLPYFSISIALNILLTLMIVTRLILHARNIRTVTGTPTGIGGLYRATVTMLIESSALVAVNSLLFIGAWGAGNHAAEIFLAILAANQVTASMLIVQRVANKSALTSGAVVSGHVNEFEVGSQGDVTNGDPMSSVDKTTVDLELSRRN